MNETKNLSDPNEADFITVNMDLMMKGTVFAIARGYSLRQFLCICESTFTTCPFSQDECFEKIKIKDKK